MHCAQTHMACEMHRITLLASEPKTRGIVLKSSQIAFVALNKSSNISQNSNNKIQN